MCNECAVCVCVQTGLPVHFSIAKDVCVCVCAMSAMSACVQTGLPVYFWNCRRTGMYACACTTAHVLDYLEKCVKHVCLCVLQHREKIEMCVCLSSGMAHSGFEV